MSQKTDQLDQALSALTVLPHIRAGEAVRELSEGLRSAVQSATMHKKKASVTVKITIEPTKGGDQLYVDMVTKPQPADPDTKPSLMFCDFAGNLTRKDPKQLELMEGGS